ncbi:MAG TPA: GNAT family N-acetyltransferase [Alphaproteobacteria bacterium]|nr:GNAT family N-acetyltransferase [Alphaproteobacteria bacterium]
MGTVQPERQKAPLDLVVRDARADDATAIQAIYGHYVRTSLATFEEAEPDRAEIEKRRAALMAEGFPYLVAERSGRVMGFAYASLYRTRTAYRHTLEDSVYVDPAAQRRGIGRALLATLIERCAALGYRQMIAAIGDSANEGSIGIHAALGFRMVGPLRSVGFKFGRWVDAVLMQRALGPGGDAPPTRP